MNLPVPDGAPLWMWGLMAVVAFIAWGLGHRQRGRTAASTSNKDDAEAQKIRVETLHLVGDRLQADLRSALEAMSASADGLPTDAQLAQLAADGSYLADYARASTAVRREALAKLSDILPRLAELQRQEGTVLGDLHAGLTPSQSQITRMGRDLAHLVEDVASLVNDFARMPNLHVGPTPPPDAKDGDLWLDTSE